jgi:hypothetical protein
MLLVDPVSTLALVGFEGLDGVSSFLHRAGHEPADGVLLPARLVHDLRQRGPVLPLEHGDHLGRLAALARPSGLLWFGALFGLGRGLGGGGLLGRLGFGGRALGRLCASLGFAFRFRLLGRSTSLGRDIPEAAAEDAAR